MTDKPASDGQQTATDQGTDPRINTTGPKPKRRRIMRYVILAALLLVVGAGGVVFWLLRSEPAHWKQHQQFLESTSQEELKEMVEKVDRKMESLVTLAESLEAEQQALTSEAETLVAAARPEGSDKPLTKKPDKPLIKEIHMTIEEANVWIIEKVEEWLKYRDYDMPPEVASPMIAMEDGQLLLSFRFDAGGFSQIFTAGFDIGFLENGNALLKLRNVTAGQLPLPVDGIGDYIRSKAPDNPTAEKAAGWLDKLDGVEFKPSLKLGKKHKVCLIDYKVTEEGITLTVRVDKRPGYAPKKPTQPQIAAASE